MEKLLPSSHLLPPRDVEPEKGKRDSFTETQPRVCKSTVTENTVTQQQRDAAKGNVGDTVNETLNSSASASCALDVTGTGGRLFVFRDPPEARDCGEVSKRKRKRNFLNLKKGSVAPTNRL